LVAAENDERAGVRAVRRRIQEEWSEITAIARRELLSDLPARIDEFLARLEAHHKHDDPASDIQRWASGLGAVTSCSFCGASIVSADAFADEIVRHYRLRGQRADKIRSEIEQAVWNSGIETGTFGSSTVCNSCNYQLGRD
jgi:hypothetical protein